MDINNTEVFEMDIRKKARALKPYVGGDTFFLEENYITEDSIKKLDGYAYYLIRALFCCQRKRINVSELEHELNHYSKKRIFSKRILRKSLKGLVDAGFVSENKTGTTTTYKIILFENKKGYNISTHVLNKLQKGEITQSEFRCYIAIFKNSVDKLPCDRDTIANLLKCSKLAVSRNVKRLKEKGIIDYDVLPKMKRRYYFPIDGELSFQGERRKNEIELEDSYKELAENITKMYELYTRDLDYLSKCGDCNGYVVKITNYELYKKTMTLIRRINFLEIELEHGNNANTYTKLKLLKAKMGEIKRREEEEGGLIELYRDFCKTP
jgi:predicted transcriptional regulator